MLKLSSRSAVRVTKYLIWGLIGSSRASSRAQTVGRVWPLVFGPSTTLSLCFEYPLQTLYGDRETAPALSQVSEMSATKRLSCCVTLNYEMLYDMTLQ